MTQTPFEALTVRAEALLAELQIPGAAIGVLHNGQVQTAGLGVTSLPHPLAVTPDTLFQVGSITKTFVGTAIMLLTERGALDLDTPLRTYLPELRLSDPDAQARVTTRHLLTHTGGWLGDYFDDLSSGDDALQRMVEERMPTLPQELPLGTTLSYNNAGFYLAGRLIERLTGQTFEAALHDLVIAPLGLADSLFFPGDVMLRRFAVGHIVYPSGPAVADPWPLGRAAHAAGGIVSTVGDLLTYAQAHMPGGPLLSEASRQAMQTPFVPAISILDHVGITWFIRDTAGTRLLYHGGGTNGQSAGFWIAPEHGFALATLTNASSGPLFNRLMMLQALHDFLGIAERDPEPIAVAPERLAACVGHYTSNLGDTRVEQTDGGLTLHVIPKGGFPRRDSPPAPAPPPAPIAFYDDTCAIVTSGPLAGNRIEFGDWTAGRPAWMRFGGRARLRTA
jgi:CubicO group peptidase (beta-lactamase class C family)